MEEVVEKLKERVAILLNKYGDNKYGNGRTNDDIGKLF